MSAGACLLWAGEARHPLPSSAGQWRVVLLEGAYSSGHFHGVAPRLVIEQAVERDVLGEPVWRWQAALPADVLFALLRTHLPGSIEKQVLAILAGGTA